ncbi:MAG: hypothetical protein OEQ13_03890 [Acidobacteriota bacterium]|nr:hypothetical protein [Acidobacteriota bacterium]
MDRIGIVGVGWRRGGADLLARFTVPRNRRSALLPRMAERIGVPELVYLATCNRVEVMYVADGLTPLSAYRRRAFAALAGREPEPGEVERTFALWTGEEAAEHLFLVACGLDSARPGETEIVGQLRDAVDESRRHDLVGPRLALLTDEALRVVSRVRHRTGIGSGKVSLAEIALAHARTRLSETGGPVTLVGVSPMTVRCARRLGREGHDVVVVNRTHERARSLADEIGGRARSLGEFVVGPEPTEVLVLATGSPVPVLTRSCLERLAARTASGRPPLLLDMAIPPDVAPRDAEATGCPRIGMDRVLREAESNRREREGELADASTLVSESLVGLRRRLAERVLAPMLAALQRRYRRTAEEGVERLLRKELGNLGAREREAVRSWAITLARRFAHIPSLGLRGLAAQAGSRGVEAFLSGLDDALAEDLKQSFESVEWLGVPGAPLEDGDGIT